MAETMTEAPLINGHAEGPIYLLYTCYFDWSPRLDAEVPPAGRFVSTPLTQCTRRTVKHKLVFLVGLRSCNTIVGVRRSGPCPRLNPCSALFAGMARSYNTPRQVV